MQMVSVTHLAVLSLTSGTMEIFAMNLVYMLTANDSSWAV